MNVLDKIKQLFAAEHVDYQLIEHAKVVTCDDAATVRGTRPEQGAKALVCFADKKPILIVLPCSRKLDLKAFKKWQQVKDLRMASAEQVKELTSLEIGSIPPLGNVMGLETFVEQELLKEEKISFNAGDHCVSMIILSEDYLRVVKPVRGEFTIEK